MLGYQQDEMLGRPATDLLITPEAQDELVRQATPDGVLHATETRWRTRSGDLLDVMVSAEPIEIEGELCVLTIGVDITEHKQAESAKVEAEKLRLELATQRELLALKENFISMMSHEFRTPLALILTAKESLQHYYERLTPERRMEKMQQIEDQVRYVVRLLDDVLTMGQASAGKLNFNPTPLDVAAFCRKIVEETRVSDKNNHPFDCQIDGDWTNAFSDPQLLQHILVNLLGNAVKYSPQNTTVSLTLSRSGDEAVLRVQDEGIGIPPEDQEHLFDAFHRGKNAQFAKGTGLGLAIVQKSVEEHGGTIRFESALGKGTTFIVRLPVGLKTEQAELR
jgi:signal transduction histidine kinase